MFQIESKMFKESRKSAVSENLAVNIVSFIFIFLLIIVAESIIPAILSNSELKQRIIEEGITNDFAKMIKVSTEVSMQSKYLIPTLICTVFGTAISVIYCRFAEARPIASMGIRKRKMGIHYLQGLGVGIVLMTIIVLISYALGIQKISVCKNVDLRLVGLFLLGFFIQGMSEEFIFRGYFMNTLGGRHNAVIAVTVSAAAFSLSHIFNPGYGVLVFINLFLFGVFASCYMLYFDDIWGVCAIHSIWNFSQGNLFGISVSGTGETESILRTTSVSSLKLLTGGDFGIEGSLITTVVLIIGTAIMMKKMKKRQALIQE